jgi:hypothetical protein
MSGTPSMDLEMQDLHSEIELNTGFDALDSEAPNLLSPIPKQQPKVAYVEIPNPKKRPSSFVCLFIPLTSI